MLNKWMLHFNKNKLRYISALILTIVISYGILIIVAIWPIDKISMEKSGLFGDSFGVVTCFFTACGFIGLIYNLSEQRKYFKYQQLTIKKQGFENTFFQMLNHLNEITKDIDYVIKEEGRVTTFLGRSAICELSCEFNSIYKKISHEMFFDSTKTEKDKVRISYNIFWSSYGSKLGHYFRWIYNLIKFVDQSDLEKRNFYMNLLMAQLSNQELMIIYYNAIFSRGRKLQRYIKDYQMMSNLELRNLIDESHQDFMNGVDFWNE